MCKVSIIVRSYNDIQYINSTMEMINNQDYEDFEIINVDSGSTDGTYEAIKKYNKNGIIYQVENYIPGKVLNEAILKCKGDIIVFNNSDCIPQNKQWLSNIIAPLLEENNNSLVAVFGRQIPRGDAIPVVKKDYMRAFGDGKISSSWFHFFSLATSAIKKSALTEFPFNPNIQYSEDIEWSYRMKSMGNKISYVNSAVVEHSHNYSFKDLYKRFKGEGSAEAFIYNKKSKFIGNFLRPFVGEFLRDISYLFKNKNFLHIPYALLYRAVQKYAVHKGNKNFYKLSS